MEQAEEQAGESEKAESPVAKRQTLEPGRIEQYLQSSDWEERVVAARLQREAVLAERKLLTTQDKQVVRDFSDVEYDVAVVNSHPASFGTIHQSVPSDASLRSTDKERKRMVALKRVIGPGTHSGNGPLSQKGPQPLLLLAGPVTAHAGLESPDAHREAIPAPSPVLPNCFEPPVGSSWKMHASRSIVLVLSGLAVGLGVGFVLHSAWLNNSSGKAADSEITTGSGFTADSRRDVSSQSVISTEESPQPPPSQPELEEAVGAEQIAASEGGQAPLYGSRDSVDAPLALRPTIDESLSEISVEADRDVSTGPDAVQQQPSSTGSSGIRFTSGSTYRIMVHLSRDWDAARVEVQLRDLGFVNVERVEANVEPTQTTVAYYDAADELVAGMLASVYQGTVIDRTGLALAARARNLDLYLAD